MEEIRAIYTREGRTHNSKENNILSNLRIFFGDKTIGTFFFGEEADLMLEILKSTGRANVTIEEEDARIIIPVNLEKDYIENEERRIL